MEQVTHPLKIGEGPHWDSSRRQLYLADLPSATILRYDPTTNQTFSAKVGKESKDIC